MSQEIFKYSEAVPVEAWQWTFDYGSTAWKVVYNQEYKAPACITSFSRDRGKHKSLQTEVDKYITEVMGRGGENARGDAHAILHSWIKERPEDAEEHTHDHWVLSEEQANNCQETVNQFLNSLVRVQFASSHDVCKAMSHFRRWIES